MDEECLLVNELTREKEILEQEVKTLTEELLETNTVVLALIQEFEKSSSELLMNDGSRTVFIEKLKKSNMEQIERIKQQEKALIQANKMVSLGHLVAGVAHEINNPTTYIRSNIELLQKYWKLIMNRTDSTPANKFKNYLTDFEEIMESIHKGTDRIMGMVNGLKDYARPDKVVYEKFDLNECIIDAYMLVKSEFVRNKIEFINKSKKEKLFVFGSRQQLEQVVINLLLNSATAIHTIQGLRQGIVAIEIKRIEYDRILLIIKDNGCGIPNENLASLFSPFFTTNQETGGTGLGLSIAYGIIKEHGGNIVVKSGKKVGAEFRITLPEN